MKRPTAAQKKEYLQKVVDAGEGGLLAVRDNYIAHALEALQLVEKIETGTTPDCYLWRATEAGRAKAQS